MDPKVRIAIVDSKKCKPNKCNLECKKSCPINISGKKCIDVEKKFTIANISEILCIGCNRCVKKCPFHAIKIINLPKSIDNQTIHRFGQNGFKLHRLPIPKPGKILGLVGSNGLGKSTAIKILGGKLKPNYGDIKNVKQNEKILTVELQDYLRKINNGEIKTIIKPQHVDFIPKETNGLIMDLLKISPNDMTEFQTRIIKSLEIDKLLDRKIDSEDGSTQLSGGELQRVAIAYTCLRENNNVFIFDEPSSYLDIKQRINMAKTIKSILNEKNYIIVIEHDLSILDYLSDYVHILYGDPGLYGIISPISAVREGINIFLDGYIPAENMRFREYELKFKISDNFDDLEKKNSMFIYPDMIKTYDHFKLQVTGGNFKNSQLVVLLGENGSGKTTFIKLLAGVIEPDVNIEMPKLNISYKPQYINPTFDGTVRDLLFKKIGTVYLEPSFQTEITKPLRIESLLEHDLKELSGGELQRVAILLCLAKSADIYLIDEPSAYLDSEQRLVVAKIIKRFVMQKQKVAFVVEHDFMMATYLADRVIIFDKTQNDSINYSNDSINYSNDSISESQIFKEKNINLTSCIISKPISLIEGVNKFLKILDITFRRDKDNFRPRINKLDSVKDREQKLSGNYFINTD